MSASLFSVGDTLKHLINDDRHAYNEREEFAWMRESSSPHPHSPEIYFSIKPTPPAVFIFQFLCNEKSNLFLEKGERESSNLHLGAV